MKQLDEPESTKPLKTPKISDKCKMTCKAFANLVLVALSFSIDFQGSEQQLSPQELEGLLSRFLMTLGVKRGIQLKPHRLLQ